LNRADRSGTFFGFEDPVARLSRFSECHKFQCSKQFDSDAVILMKIPLVECNGSGLKRIVLKWGPPPPRRIILGDPTASRIPPHPDAKTGWT
jgi:hypothetical protein